MRVREHIPGFVTGFEAQTADVDSVDALLALDWIKRWDAPLQWPFHRFSVAGGEGNTIMAEYDEGRRWYVVAYLPDELPEWLTLPKWEPKSSK